MVSAAQIIIAGVMDLGFGSIKKRAHLRVIGLEGSYREHGRDAEGSAIDYPSSTGSTKLLVFHALMRLKSHLRILHTCLDLVA